MWRDGALPTKGGVSGGTGEWQAGCGIPTPDAVKRSFRRTPRWCVFIMHSSAQIDIYKADRSVPLIVAADPLIVGVLHRRALDSGLSQCVSVYGGALFGTCRPRFLRWACWLAGSVFIMRSSSQIDIYTADRSATETCSGMNTAEAE